MPLVAVRYLINYPARFFSAHVLRARYVSTLLLLIGSIVQSQAWAQDPANNQANLNFVGADIEAVVRAIGHYTGNTFVIDPRVKGTINLVSEKPVSKMQALEMLSSVLDVIDCLGGDNHC
jgi:type II secretory pathway component GspD/PulD (secretin)